MTTASDTIRFRCHGCDGLLNTSAAKIGRVVICPRCRSEMIVPNPAELSDAEGKTMEMPIGGEFPSLSRPDIPQSGPVSPSNSAEAVALPIRIDPSSIDEGSSRRGDRDVPIPRSALTAWALFAVLALGVSFLAGVLFGRYLSE